MVIVGAGIELIATGKAAEQSWKFDRSVMNAIIGCSAEQNILLFPLIAQ
jgi:hypothetical protein